MTKDEKIASLSSAMEVRTRRDSEDDTYYCFTETAPEELRSLYLEHYEVKDIDYETFSRACDIVSEIYAEKPDIAKDDAQDEIYERATDSASVYTYPRLQYLDNTNESEVSDLMREYDLTSIADACAAWYDRQVEQAAILINEWIKA